MFDAPTSEDELISVVLDLQTKYLNNKKILQRNREFIAETQKELFKHSIQNYKHELEQLKAGADEKLKSWQLQYAAALSDINSTKQLYEEQYMEHEHELLERKNHLQSCKDKIAAASAEQVNAQPESAQNETDSNILVMDQIRGIDIEINDVKDSFHTQEIRHENQESIFKSLQQEVEFLQTKCDHNKSVLSEAISLRETLEGDVFILRTESLGPVKDRQDIALQTNSVFDEVNENRTDMHTNINQMNDIYLEMKRKRNQLLLQLEDAQREKVFLKFECEDNKEDIHFDKFVIEDTYKDCIAMFAELDKKLEELNIQRNLFQSGTISPADGDVYFKVLNKLDEIIKFVETDVCDHKYIYSNFKFNAMPQKKEIESLKIIFQEKRRINDNHRATLEAMQQAEFNENMICICTLQKDEK